MNKKFIPEYRNQDEKKKFFSLNTIDTESQLYNFMSSLPGLFDEKKGIWRGLPESRYKLYNSLQRKNLITGELKSIQDVTKRIEDLTDKLTTWNRNVVQKSFYNNHKLHHIPIYAALSILQHHGCETPLLDWTRNPNVALYFAMNNQKEMIIKDKIDNYFSIYFLHHEHPYIKFSSKVGYEFFTSKDIKLILNKIKIFRKFKVSKKEINNYLNASKNILNDIKNFPIQLINDDTEDKLTHYLMFNNNINAQSGLFTLNADPINPLEVAILNRTNELSKKSQNIDINKAHSSNLSKFICFDIHKKFIPRISNALKSEKISITQDTMFPDFNKLKDEITFEKKNNTQSN